MTQVADIYNAIVDKIEGALTTHVRVPDPYSLDQNAYVLMKDKAFGMGIGPGRPTNREVCKNYWERTFTIALIQRVTSTENNIDTREILEQELLNDQDILEKAFYNDITLGGQVAKSEVGEDGGVVFIDADQQRFMSIELNLTIEYFKT